MGRATRSFDFQFVNQALPLITRIPPFAKNVAVYLNFPSVGVVPFDFYGGAFQIRFLRTRTGVALPLAVYSASQLVSYLDAINEVVGHPEPLPITERGRFVAVTNNAGVIQTNNNLEVAFQYEIGL